MGYIDAFRSRKDGKVWVSTRHDGKRVISKHNVDYHFYVADDNGEHKNIYGDRVKKLSFTSESEFYTAKNQYSDNLCHESEFNPIFRVLEQNYGNVQEEVPHIAFFDIETDFDKNKGYSSPEDAANPIISIALYLDWSDTSICLAIPPDTMSFSECLEVANKFEHDHVIMFHSEEEMLLSFLDLIEDADTLSGWNCIDKNEYVWLEDRITQLSKVEKENKTKNFGDVLDTNDSGEKRINVLKTVTGHELRLTDEHIVPVYWKGKNEYKYPNSLQKNTNLLKTGTLKNRLKQGESDYYVELPRNKNTNKDYTYGEYITDNLDLLMDNGFDILIEHDDVDKDIRDTIRKNEYKNPNGGKKYYYYSMIKKYDPNCDEYIGRYIRNNNVIRVKAKSGSRPFGISSRDSISNDALATLGFVFTDGHYSKCDNNYGICNKHFNVVDHYRNNFCSGEYKIREGKDGCYYSSMCFSSEIGLLHLLAFDENMNKRLNVERLSRLSSDQFVSFMNGLIDGDGGVTKTGINICNVQEQSQALAQLLLWNDIWNTVQQNNVYIPFTNRGDNLTLFENLTLIHPERKEKLADRVLFEKKNSPNKILNSFSVEDKHIVKIKSIAETNEYVETGDISTEEKYFIANGIKVHNSSSYDIPYVVHRIQRILGRNETHRLCLWHEKPRKRTIKQKTGAASFKEFTTYSLVGKTHLDYMEVYKNFTYESKHSYALDNIASEELDEKKIEYDGRLHELYRNNFEKFIVYNIKDTMLLYRLEQKLKYLELVFGIAWSNCVLPEQVLGTVRLMEQAVTLEAHKRGMILPDTLKKRGPDKKTVGGWVYGQSGVHDWVGSIDLTSLYPSIIRSLNMSPETTVGQISNDHTYEEINRWVGDIKSRGFTGWWTKDGGQFMTLEMEEYMKGSNKELKVEFDNEDGFKRMSARELKEVINGSDSLCVSANGTIFRTDVRGVIPSLLTRWFDERVAMKKKMNDIKNILDGKIKIPDHFLSEVIEKSKPKSVKNVYGFTLDSMEDIIQSGNGSELVSFLNNWGLVTQKNGVLKPKNKKVWESADKYWDKQQLIKKILLNSLYGGLLNEYFRFYDQRIGQSVTLTGRSITKHMTATANQIIMGEYDHLGEAVAYNDTDSVASDSLVEINGIKKTIEEHFEEFCDKYGVYINDKGQEFTKINSDNNLSPCYDPENDAAIDKDIYTIYRHKCSKRMFEIELDDGSTVKVTEDHSIMVERDCKLLEIKPTEIKDNDIFIKVETKSIKRAKVRNVKEITNSNQEYVYDVVMKDPEYPYFVANDILVHNSVYMTIAPAVEQGVESLSTDNIIETYDVISNQVNDTFTDFMTTTFNAYPDYAKAIRCDREVVGKRMYVVTKKKYALLVIDDEGQRKDIDGELGKFKITGLDIRRSDTPKLVQDWLSNCLKILLSGGSYEDIETQIYKYAEEYRQLKPWQMGAPKSANGVTKYQKLVKQYMEDKANGYNPPKPPTPGHINGAFNWNKLIDIHNDKESDRLIDGMRIVFCYLKRNSFNMNRISYPSDQIQMPQWFVDLPFDVDEMFERNFVQKFYMLFRKSDIKLKFNTMDNVMTSSDLGNLFNKN